KYDVHTKEQADHSLPYVVAVALLDGEVTPRQFLPERIAKDDVQALLKKVHVGTQAHIGKKAFEGLDTYTQQYPKQLPGKITIKLRDGREYAREERDYEGFFTRPMPSEAVTQKFEALAEPHTSSALRNQIIEAVNGLDQINI